MLPHEGHQLLGLPPLRPVLRVEPGQAHQVVHQTFLEENVSSGRTLEQVGHAEDATLDAVPWGGEGRKINVHEGCI